MSTSKPNQACVIDLNKQENNMEYRKCFLIITQARAKIEKFGNLALGTEESKKDEPETQDKPVSKIWHHFNKETAIMKIIKQKKFEMHS